MDINSELKLLSLDDETADKVRDIAQDNDLTRKERGALPRLKIDTARFETEFTTALNN